MGSEHTAECIAASTQYAAAVDAYKARWPNHCEACGGWGGATSYYDPSPSGVGLSPGRMADFEPCEECVCKGLCPRCGAATIDEDGNGPCTACGWTDETEGLDPDGPGCICPDPDEGKIYDPISGEMVVWP